MRFGAGDQHRRDAAEAIEQATNCGICVIGDLHGQIPADAVPIAIATDRHAHRQQLQLPRP